MFKRDHIERFLKVNGVDIDDSDEQIKSVLISAQWHEDDVEAAVLVLRENKTSHQTHVESLHRVFRSDDRLRPETISSLLGITMDVSNEDISLSRKKRNQAMSPSQILQIAMTSLILSLIFVFASMWYLKMGLFHQAFGAL